jgi:hypothetical protein
MSPEILLSAIEAGVPGLWERESSNPLSPDARGV